MFFTPPVRSYCHRMRHLSPTHTVGKQLCHAEQREYSAVSGTGESVYGSLSISQLSSLPRHWSFLPRKPVWYPYHFSRNKSSREAIANQNFARMLVVSALPFLKILQLWSRLRRVRNCPNNVINPDWSTKGNLLVHSHLLSVSSWMRISPWLCPLTRMTNYWVFSFQNWAKICFRMCICPLMSPLWWI